jgi:hypothetical protein
MIKGALIELACGAALLGAIFVAYRLSPSLGWVLLVAFAAIGLVGSIIRNRY